MTDGAHLCLTCKLAKWKKTAAGRLHPDGTGRCLWKLPHIPTPKAWYWDTWGGTQPKPSGGGYIDRRPTQVVAQCETYEALK